MKKKKRALPLKAVLVVLVAFAVEGRAASRPNVVFFLVDDMGWMDSSVYGSQFYKTPAMERLAKSSVRFVNAYSASPLCSPSRTSIMSGQYPARHGLTTAWGHKPIDPNLPKYQEARASSPVLLPNSKFVLELEQYTVAEAFHDAGYRTGFIGKWHMGFDPAYWPEHQGFEFTFHGAPDAGPVWPKGYFSPYGFPAGTVTDGPVGEYITDRATDEALKFIHNDDGRPFFLCLWHWGVHGPWQAKAKLIEYYIQHPDPTGRQQSTIMAAMLQSVDKSLGRLLDDLEASGLDRNTIIIFTSDNGGVVKKMVGNPSIPVVDEGKNPQPKPLFMTCEPQVPVTSNAPLRNGKASVFEGGTRVPALIRWPGVTDRCRVEETPIMGIDYYPTLVEMCGLEMKPSQVIDGVSLVPLLKGNALARDTLFCYFPHSFGKWSPAGAWVRQGDWKLIEVFDPSTSFPNGYELYNLRDDMGETKNLVDKYPERVEAMKKLLQRHYRDTNALLPIPNPGFNGVKPVAASMVQKIQGWAVSGPGSIQTLENGTLQMDARGIYTGTLPRVKGVLTVRVRAKIFKRANGSVFWDGGAQKQFGPDRKAMFKLVADGAWHDYEVGFTAAAPLGRLRIDLGSGQKRLAEIEWIRLCSPDGGVLVEWVFAGQATL